MRKFKVIALSVGGSNNRIYNSQEIVNEDNFPRGLVDDLVKQKFLEEIPADESTEEEEAVSPDNNDGVKTIDEISKKDIIKDLTVAGLQFNTQDTKANLFELWKSLQK